ncbi:MAG: hypothetical protein HXY53_01850 [Nitrospirae bacterium]|nr:hypothetical protein [Nitrospirota bacterium]
MFIDVLMFFVMLAVTQLFARLFAMPLTIFCKPLGHSVALIIWPVIIILYYLI